MTLTITPQKSGIKAERVTAKRWGAQAHPGSGSLDSYKADLTFGEYLVECKTTRQGSLSLKLGWLDKITREAEGRTKTPAMSLQFVDAFGRSKRGGRWVVVPEHVFLGLVAGEGGDGVP